MRQEDYQAAARLRDELTCVRDRFYLSLYVCSQVCLSFDRHVFFDLDWFVHLLHFSRSTPLCLLEAANCSHCLHVHGRRRQSDSRSMVEEANRRFYDAFQRNDFKV